MEISGYITNLGKYNEGELIGEWIDFPIDEDDLQEVLTRIGIGGAYEEYFFTDWEGPDFGEYPDIDFVNHAAEVIESSGLDDATVDTIFSYLNDVQEAVDCIENESFTIYPDCYDDYDLGDYVVNNLYGDTSELPKETLERYFDYEAFGRDVRLEDGLDRYSGGYIGFT